MRTGSDDLAQVRARARLSAGRMAWFEADLAAALAQLEESLELFRRANDTLGTLEAMSGLVLVLTRRGEFARTLALLEEARAITRTLANRQEALPVLAGLARAAALVADEKSLFFAREWGEETAQEARAAGDKRSLAWSLDSLAICHYYGGELKAARAELEEGIPLFEELGDAWGVSLQKWLLGNIARREGKLEDAWNLNRAAITGQTQGNSRQGLPYMLDSFAFVALEAGHAERAARLLFASQSISDQLGNVFQPLYQCERDEYLTVLRASLSLERWDEARNKGRALSLEAAVALGLEPLDL